MDQGLSLGGCATIIHGAGKAREAETGMKTNEDAHFCRGTGTDGTVWYRPWFSRAPALCCVGLGVLTDSAIATV